MNNLLRILERMLQRMPRGETHAVLEVAVVIGTAAPRHAIVKVLSKLLLQRLSPLLRQLSPMLSVAMQRP